MFTKNIIGRLFGILLVLMFPLSSGLFSGVDVAHAQTEPTLQVEINHDWVAGDNWPEGNLVTMTIDDPDTPDPIDYTDTQIVELRGSSTRVRFYFGFDVKPGHIVTLTDGETTKTHTALDIRMTKVDYAANTIEGYATPGSELHVYACNEGYTLQANGNGYWIASFTCALNTVSRAHVKQFDLNASLSTTFFWSPSKFQVEIAMDWVEGYDWLPDTTVSLTIDDPDAPGVENYTDTKIVTANTSVAFDFAGIYDVEPGHIVTLTDGGITEVYEVEYLSVYEVNPDTDLVRGVAEPGKELEVTVWGSYWISVPVYTDAITGEWEVDFTGIADITSGIWGSVRSATSWDENHTQYIWIAPIFPPLPVDDFNRANGRIGGNWTGKKSKYRIYDNQLRVRSNGSNTDIYWTEEFGSDQEAFFTFTQINETATELNLLLKSQSKKTWGDGVIEVLYDAQGNNVQVWTWEWPGGWVKYGDDIPVTFMSGDTFKARARPNGIVEVYRNGELLDTRDVSTWSYFAEGGYIGLWFIGAEGTMIDDFGGGTVP